LRILVVEDERLLNSMLVEALTDEGYAVDHCYNGQEAMEYVRCAPYDTIVLDVMMPVMDGFTFLRLLRESDNRTPVVFLTARDSVDDRVHGLESGADYYLPKPFSFRELIAVIRAMVRKTGENKTNLFTVGDLSVDISTRQVKRGGTAIDLTPKEYAVLEYMIRNKGTVLSQEQIENNVWNFEYEGGTNVVNVYIGYLRKKIDADAKVKLIHTVWGVGWVLKEE